MTMYKGMRFVVSPVDSEHRGFYEHARQHRLMVQKCSDCGLLRGAPGAGCPFCTSLKWTWQQVSGKGTIYSYQIVTQAIQPAFRDWVPYAIVLVDLDEQRRVPWRNAEEGEYISVRMVANLVKPNDPTKPEDQENVAIGKRVEVCFIDLDDKLALPQFRLSNEPPEHTPWRAPV
ncbi:MAG: hypothetical protein EXR47_03750 [Dehalococcoidia bacterium]|nr:hypothetical protein [Dehalococcoidia bacterium]